jgi:hypothetical protein
MKPTTTTNILLAIIALALVALVLRPAQTAEVVEAQTNDRNLFIEPGVYMLRAPDASQQVFGKVVIDLQSGKIWGFPTYAQDPYPTDPLNPRPRTSRPFQLGKFAFEDMYK